MFRTMTAAAILTALLFGAMRAEAGTTTNGIFPNGAAWNGVMFNGIGFNGVMFNGIGFNGKSTNGIRANAAEADAARSGTLAIVGVELPSSRR